MSFHTVVSAQRPRGVIAQRPLLRQAIFRPLGYKFTAQDYIAYEHVRNYVLGQRISRAVLMKGGILWRLAYEFMNPGIVLDGPDVITRAYAQGYVMTDPCPRGAYVDDDLNEDEVFVIIGGYLVPSELHRSHNRLLSWWPRPKMWARSSFHVGLWTPIAEEWYQAMLVKYRNGSQAPKTNSEWEYITRLSRRSKTMHVRARLALEDVILHHQ